MLSGLIGVGVEDTINGLMSVLKLFVEIRSSGVLRNIFLKEKGLLHIMIAEVKIVLRKYSVISSYYKKIPERISIRSGNVKMLIFISLFNMKISHTLLSRSKYWLSDRVPVIHVIS